MRFFIRDLLWLMVVVAVATCWLVEHFAFRRQAARWNAERAELSDRVFALEREKLVFNRNLFHEKNAEWDRKRAASKVLPGIIVP
jgi:hypothetical protein